MPCDLKAILEIAHRHDLAVIEDGACAIGSEILWDGSWEKIGVPRGDVCSFSFHPRKLLTTGDGGMLTTSNPEYDKRFRLLRQHGMGVPDTVRHSADEVIFESYMDVGYNYRMTDIQASVGRVELQRIPEMLEQRRLMVKRYKDLLSGIPGLGLPVEPEWARPNWQSFCVRLPSGFDQREVMNLLLAERIATRRGVMCSHREPAYAVEPWVCGCGFVQDASGSVNCECLTNSESAQDECIILPLYHEMSEVEQDMVVEKLHSVLL